MTKPWHIIFFAFLTACGPYCTTEFPPDMKSVSSECDTDGDVPCGCFLTCIPGRWCVQPSGAQVACE